jgi:exonuclease SbcD
MRILHTSDWHIGRGFFGYDLHDAQQVFIDHIINVVKEEGVDVLLISGDLYDRSLPSLASIDLMAYALSQLSKLTKVIITSGNHDSSRRLGFGKELFESANVFIRTSVDDITRPILLPHGNDQLAIYGIPYLDPYTTSSQLIERQDSAAARTVDHGEVLRAAIGRINLHRESVKANRTIVMSHAWFAGGENSESEVNIGGLGQAPINLLQGFDYAALGHLHKPKVIDDHIRYSGSALPYSFSERDVEKLTYLIDLSADHLKATPITSPKYKELVQIEDSVENLLRSSKYEGLENAFVKIKITDERPPVNPKSVLGARFSFIVELFTNVASLTPKNYEELRAMSPSQLVESFLAEVRAYGPNEWEREQIANVLDRIEAGAPLIPSDPFLLSMEDEECSHEDIQVQEVEDRKEEEA